MPEQKDYYWEKHGVKPKGKPYRYRIFVDPDWLAGSENPNDKIHGLPNAKKKELGLLPKKVSFYDTPEMRKASYEKIMPRLWYQAFKARIDSKRKDYEIYKITRIGTPGKGEWLCSKSHYVASSAPGLHQKHKKYFLDLEKFSVRTYNYLSDLGWENYSSMLNAYLRRLILYPVPFSYELERLSKAMENINGWGKIQCLGSTTSKRGLSGMKEVFLNSTKIKPD